MRKIFTLLTLLLSLGLTSVQANENQPQGIDLGEYAFGIPTEQLNFTDQSPFTLSFWVNVKEYNHNEGGTQFINIRDPKFSSNNYPGCDWGYIHSTIGDAYDMFGNKLGEDMMSFYAYEGGSSGKTVFKHIEEYKFSPGEWVHISFQYYLTSKPEMFVYVNGKQSLKFDPLYDTPLRSRPKDAIIMIGGYAWKRSPLNAYVDKVQFYNRALTQTEVQASMYEPLLNDESLLGYWDFENGCTTDSEGYMMADKGTIKATMYNILQTEEGLSNGTEIKPFTFAEGVNPESVLQGVEESTAEVSNTKAYVSDGVLYIENAEGVNTVTVYDAMGRNLTPNPSPVERGATNAQIELPSALKGVIMVKVNNEVVKVICE